MNKMINKNLSWHIVEKKINEEIDWLRKVIHVNNDEAGLVTNREISKWATNYFLYRLIAILIVSGQIKAREINSANLWGKGLVDKVHRHGKEWHSRMMDKIDDYFRSQGYEITTEPHTHQGRADLGVFMKGKKDLYVEVGTISLYKLCLNLHFMKDCIILLVPSENQVIEFER